MAGALLLVVASAPLPAQERSTVVLPPAYDPGHAYPVVVLLPYTGGTAGRLLWGYGSGGPDEHERHLEELLDYVDLPGREREDFIVVLVPGIGTPEDYATGEAWAETIRRYETRILDDLGEIESRYSVDTTRIVLTGFSMGGDLAWAITLRNPGVFRGAIVMGSRASYRVGAATLDALAAADTRYFFTLGDHEERVRLDGARAATELLERHGIPVHYREIPETGHSGAPLEEFSQALRFVLRGEPPPPLVTDPGRGSGSPGVWKDLSAGTQHACGVTVDGRVFCWGDAESGRLGDGSSRRRSIPGAVAADIRLESVDVSNTHSCGLDPDGGLVCWGRNDYGKLGDGTTTHAETPRRTAGQLRFRQIALGSGVTCAVTLDGDPYCWGFNLNGELGDGTTRSRRSPRPVAVDGPVARVAIGEGMGCVLTADRTPRCWGRVYRQAGWGPLAVPGALELVDLTAASGHACGLTPGGETHCWGWNFYGGGSRRESSDTPVPVVSDPRLVGIDSGHNHTCGLTRDGRAFCWGENGFGQLGDGTNESRWVPVPVAGDLRFRSVDAGNGFTCGLTTDGAAFCWGRNQFGQLGDGSRVARNVPAAVVNPP